jgi:hypothetical protein
MKRPTAAARDAADDGTATSQRDTDGGEMAVIVPNVSARTPHYAPEFSHENRAENALSASSERCDKPLRSTGCDL